MSKPKSFKHDVQGLFSKYVTDMQDIKLATKQGTPQLLLNDYDSVKALAWKIQVSIHGYDYDARNDRWLVDEPHRLRDEKGEYVKSAPHPMPPEDRGRLPQEAIDIYDQWVRDGMLP